MRRLTPLIVLVVLFVLAAFAYNRLAAPAETNVPSTLDKTYTSTDGTLTFNYPAGWVIREEAEQIFLATSDQMLQSTGSSAAVTPGQFVVGIIVFPAARVPGLGAETGPLDVLSAFAPFLSGASETAGDANVPSFGSESEITIGSRRAARAEGTSGADQSLLIVLEVQPEVFTVMAAGSAAGELARFEPTLLAIAETMQYSETTTEATESPEATAEVGN